MKTKNVENVTGFTAADFNKHIRESFAEPTPRETIEVQMYHKIRTNRNMEYPKVGDKFVVVGVVEDKDNESYDCAFIELERLRLIPESEKG